MNVYSKESRKLVLGYLGADNTESSDNGSASASDIRLSGNVVEVYPASVGSGNDSLCAENEAVLMLVFKSGESLAESLLGELDGSFYAPAGKYLVGMVVMVVMVVTTALALLVVIVMMVMMMMMMLMLVLVVMVALAIGIVALVIVVMMVVTTALLVVVMVVMMMLMLVLVVMVALAIGIVALVTMMMMVVMGRLGGKALKLCFKGISALHSLKKLLTVKLLPRGGDDNGGLVMLAQKLYCGGYLGIAHAARMAHNDSSCVVYLIKEEFAEVLNVHLALVRIADGGEAVEDYALKLQPLNGFDDVGELTDSGRLDEDSFGGVLLDNLGESLAEVTDEATADTARIHFVYGDSRILKEASVYTDITELVLDKNYLFTCISLGEHLLDKCGLSCAEETGKYVDLGHVFNVLSVISLKNYFIIKLQYNIIH